MPAPSASKGDQGSDPLNTPRNVPQLNEGLLSAAEDLGIPVARARLMLNTLVVSQLLPQAVAVKGGMGIKLRLGERGTRASADLDAVAAHRGSDFEQEFRAHLARGWGWVPPSINQRRRNPDAADRVAFTGTLRSITPRNPGHVSPDYLMHPYRVSLSFLGKPWGGIDVEVSGPEIAPPGHSHKSIDPELVAFAERFEFGELAPVELIDLELQIAQKIHAVTDPSVERPHDLVDLQLLWSARPDVSLLRDMSVRTFRWPNSHPWPPVPLRQMNGWDAANELSRAETEVDGITSVVPTVASAREWLLRVIGVISSG